MLAQQLTRPQQLVPDHQRHVLSSKHAYSITGTPMRLPSSTNNLKNLLIKPAVLAKSQVSLVSPSFQD